MWVPTSNISLLLDFPPYPSWQIWKWEFFLPTILLLVWETKQTNLLTKLCCNSRENRASRNFSLHCELIKIHCNPFSASKIFSSVTFLGFKPYSREIHRTKMWDTIVFSISLWISFLTASTFTSEHTIINVSIRDFKEQNKRSTNSVCWP